MSVLQGADSATPQPDLYRGREVWGVYVAGNTPHIWSHDEVNDLGRNGVRAVVPIVVPPGLPAEGEAAWWSVDETAGYPVLEELARAAQAWGASGILCLDIEENVAEAMGMQRQNVATAWTIACKAHGFEPWTYGGQTWHADTVGKGKRWLAHWDDQTAPVEPPAGFDAIQYQGNAEGGRIDLDLFAGGLTYLGTDLQPGVIGVSDHPIEPIPAPAAPPAEGTEVDHVTDALEAQTTQAEHIADAPPTPTHGAELHDLAAKIEVHLAELRALADRMEPPK